MAISERAEVRRDGPEAPGSAEGARAEMQRDGARRPGRQASPRAESAARRWAWTAVAGLALVAAARWLRAPDVRYLVVCIAATGGMVALALRGPMRRATVGAAAAMMLFCLVAEEAERELWRIEHAWPEYRARVMRAGERELRRQTDQLLASLQRAASEALAARESATRRAFELLEPLVSRDGDRGVILVRDGAPVAWAGRSYAPVDSLTAPVGAAVTPFYVTLYATASEGSSRAVATAVLHADSPADSLTDAEAEAVARRVGLAGYEFYAGAAMGSAPADAFTYAARGRPLFRVQALARVAGDARQRALDRARVAGGVALAAAMVLVLVAVWRRERSVLRRLAPIGVSLVAVWLVPLNTLSNVSALFDPSVYRAQLGGAFTSTVGSLALTSALVLLGTFVVLRARIRAPARWVPLLVVLAIMAGAPFLLGDLSRGITSPPGGATTGLWLAWEVALCLAAAALLLGAASAGSAALGGGRGLPPALAPALATAAALLGPVVLRAEADWPEWYPYLWIAAIGAMAMTRRHRTMVMTAASVAALGATLVTWREGIRERRDLAERDVGRLSEVDPAVTTLLERTAAARPDSAPPRTEVDLLRAYIASGLQGTGYPVVLASWLPNDDGTAGTMAARLALAPFQPPPALQGAVIDARATRTPVLRRLTGGLGAEEALALPFTDGTVMTMVVAPRTRLIAEDSYAALLGLAPRESGEPPYSLTLTSIEAPPGTSNETRWTREGFVLHGHHFLRSDVGGERVHVELDLRSFSVVVQRGTLVVMLDLALILGLWMLSVSPSGAFGRWLGAWRRRWARSFRAQLTLALFAFFVIPALAFAAWSYQRLQAEDRQSRELLVGETLRRVLPGPSADIAEADAPLLEYRAGALSWTQPTVFDALAPIGRLVPPRIYTRVVLNDEAFASDVERVGVTSVLFGYRAPERAGERVVVAAPARGNEEALDRRRRDLGVLVMFATVLGALAALWLSGVAARTLAEPIGRLRGAALAIAGGELEPILPPQQPVEFQPVFSAFRRMAGDLRESRAALEQAQRRTAAVLRNVASGVVAVDARGAIVLANPRAESLAGASLTPGAPLAGRVPEEVAARVMAFLRATPNESPEAGQDEEEFDVDLGGQQLHARLTRFGGGLARGGAGAVLTLDDVTALARAQRVLAWGEMARQVAHEIKNPLTPIRLGVQHLKRARADARPDFDTILDRNVSRILAEIDRLDQIARAFSRYGMAPAERLPAETVDAAAVARDVVELERMGRDGVEWRLDGIESAATARAREAELREVLLNILENARLAAARRVELRVGREGGRVTIEVIDDGHGIPAHVLPRIFEPHFSTRTSGSGLGLAISRQLIEGWGGEISIASGEGVGTTVRIELQGATERGDE